MITVTAWNAGPRASTRGGAVTAHDPAARNRLPGRASRRKMPGQRGTLLRRVPPGAHDRDRLFVDPSDLLPGSRAMLLRGRGPDPSSAAASTGPHAGAAPGKSLGFLRRDDGLGHRAAVVVGVGVLGPDPGRHGRITGFTRGQARGAAPGTGRAALAHLDQRQADQPCQLRRDASQLPGRAGRLPRRQGMLDVGEVGRQMIAWTAV